MHNVIEHTVVIFVFVTSQLFLGLEVLSKSSTPTKKEKDKKIMKKRNLLSYPPNDLSITWLY